MPRKPRELSDGGIYHVFNRGNDRKQLFFDEEDFGFFLKCLGTVKTELCLDIYHYCLMSNHFHILLQVTKGQDLPTLMHRVQLRYAQYFKKKYGLIGHVFQERFRSPRIPVESYYLQCGRYIERNPVKAGLVKNPIEYFHSSVRFYALGEENSLVTPNLYYEQMGNTEKERRRHYQEFLSLDDPYASLLEEALARG